MGVLWMVDGVFCRNPNLGLHLTERAEARAAQEEPSTAGAQDLVRQETSQPFGSADQETSLPKRQFGGSYLTDPAMSDSRFPEIPLPPANSEVAAQPRALLENRASELPQDWERITAIERSQPTHQKLDTLDSSTTTVKDLMSRAVLTATSTTPVSEAIELLDETGFHHLPIVDQERRLIGLVSDRDLLGKEGELREFMSASILTASPDTALEQAAQALAKQRFHSLVVVDDKQRPIGMLTSSDLLAFLVSHPAMRLWRQG